MIIGRNLLTYTIADVSSENLSWPATNLIVFDKRVRFWKATVATDSYVVIDFGSPQALKAVGVIDVNYSSCEIQGHASDSWGSPSFDPGVQTIAQENNAGLYRLHLKESDLTGFNYRYLRLFIPTQATTDGEAVFRTGVLAVSVDSEEYLFTIDKSGIAMKRNQAVSIQPMHGGGDEKALNGVPYSSISFDITRLRTASEFALISRLFAIGETELILFAPGDELREETNSGQYAFIMRKETPPEVLIADADTMQVDLKETI